MKKMIIPFICVSVLFLSCTKKMNPSTSTTTEPSKEKALAVSDTVAATKSVVPVDTNPVAGMDPTTLISNGEAVYKAKCGACHGLKDPTNYTTTRWDAILKEMIPRAKLDGAQQNEVLAYVRAHARQ
jgi:mono/diheme cytochrome c family protein